MKKQSEEAERETRKVKRNMNEIDELISELDKAEKFIFMLNEGEERDNVTREEMIEILHTIRWAKRRLRHDEANNKRMEDIKRNMRDFLKYLLDDEDMYVFPKDLLCMTGAPSSEC